MLMPKTDPPLICTAGKSGTALDFDFTMAFQPIVNTTSCQIFAQEALVRGPGNEPAKQVLGQVTNENRYRFDQACRVKAIQLAAQLRIDSFLSINFLPNAVYRPETCIRTTVEAATSAGFPLERIIFEITEGEKIDDHAHLRTIVREYQRLGFKTAIDDFGAGFSGLNLLAEFQPDLIKLDMALTRHIDHDKTRRSIVGAVTRVCRDLDIKPVAEGVETYEEWLALEEFGIELFQGYYFARPAFQSLAVIPPVAFRQPT